MQDPRIQPILVQQIFPQQSVQTGQAQLVTFDMAYYPTDRGPYNFDARPGSIDPATGKLNNPTTRWGGIMRALQQTDFETANIEVLQFWMLSPFDTTIECHAGGRIVSRGDICISTWGASARIS